MLVLASQVIAVEEIIKSFLKHFKIILWV